MVQATSRIRSLARQFDILCHMPVLNIRNRKELDVAPQLALPLEQTVPIRQGRTCAELQRDVTGIWEDTAKRRPRRKQDAAVLDLLGDGRSGLQHDLAQRDTIAKWSA